MTTPVTLPETRLIRVDKPRLIDWGGRLTPPLGGAVQTINRLGSRWALDITIPVTPTDPDARLLASKLAQAKLNGALVWLRQDGFDPGIPGAPVVDGASQAGSTLAIKGFTPGYTVREGQFFSLISGSRRYVHMATATITTPTTGASAGKASVPIVPMLRVSPADAAVCEFAKPYLQGSLAGNEVSWERQPGNFAVFGQISIMEDE